MTPQLILTTLRERHDFSEEEFKKLLPLFEEQFLSKNEMLFEQDSVVKYVWFTLKGCLRQYHTTPDGNERNMFFHEEGW